MAMQPGSDVHDTVSTLVPDIITEHSTDDEVRNRLKELASESAELHRNVERALRDAYACKHGNRTITDWICKK